MGAIEAVETAMLLGYCWIGTGPALIGKDAVCEDTTFWSVRTSRRSIAMLVAPCSRPPVVTSCAVGRSRVLTVGVIVAVDEANGNVPPVAVAVLVTPI